MKRIRCPIHNYISLDDDVLRIVDLSMFQRLRGIKQLGMAYFVYPGAQHSRFEHSLGVYHLGDGVSRLLGLSDYESRMIALSGLLHDIGHGPFSHIMETVSDMTHEERGSHIIHHSPIADLLKDMSMDPGTITDIMLGKSEYSSLISSEIDIDRMDYLLRDAHYTGVSSALDAGRLSAVMEFENHHLVFRESGLAAVEALLLARFMMYPYVYFHHTTRVAERMMARALEILLAQEGVQLMDEVSEESLWSLDDVDLISLLRRSEGLPGSLMKAIDERQLFKRGWELSLSQLLQDLEPGCTQGEVLELLRAYLTQERRARIEHHIASVLDIDPLLVMFDCPLPPELETRTIMIKRRKGALVSARSLSQMISIMESAQLDHWKFRVFLPREHRFRMDRKLMESITSHFGSELEPITLGSFFEKK